MKLKIDIVLLVKDNSYSDEEKLTITYIISSKNQQAFIEEIKKSFLYEEFLMDIKKEFGLYSVRHDEFDEMHHVVQSF